MKTSSRSIVFVSSRMLTLMVGMAFEAEISSKQETRQLFIKFVLLLADPRLKISEGLLHLDIPMVLKYQILPNLAMARLIFNYEAIV